MGRKRLCANFTWRDNDPAYRSERRNDRVVFRKIKLELEKTAAGRQPSVVRIVRRLSQDSLWASRLVGKTPESWKRTYNRWRQNIEKRDTVQAENDAPGPRVHWPKSDSEKFYQETGVKYPPPRDDGDIKSASGEARPATPSG